MCPIDVKGPKKPVSRAIPPPREESAGKPDRPTLPSPSDPQLRWCTSTPLIRTDRQPLYVPPHVRMPAER